MKEKTFSMKRRVIAAIFTDLAVLAVFLVTFSYFHHVRVRDKGPTAIPSAVAPTGNKPAPTVPPMAAVSSDEPVAAQPTPSNGDLEDSAGAPSADTGLLGGQYVDLFTAGEVVSDETHYQSANVSVQIAEQHTENATYFVADIYIKDITSFRTAVALDYKEFNDNNRKNCMQVSQLSELTNAIVAISGDNYVFRNAGVLAIRNGLEWAKDMPFTDDICTLFYDGTMETFSTNSSAACKQYVEAIYAKGPYQVWCFGPSLLDENGQPLTRFNSSVNTQNPRSAIGYYEPGHYCFILVDGRQKNYSIGLTLPELSQVFHDLGCKVAYNLDGGDTVAMTFGLDMVNHPQDTVPRPVSDIVYVGEPQTNLEG
ncbi:MAG: phosphodiester glycosidase family protein [Clostridia bacterium]